MLVRCAPVRIPSEGVRSFRSACSDIEIPTLPTYDYRF